MKNFLEKWVHGGQCKGWTKSAKAVANAGFQAFRGAWITGKPCMPELPRVPLGAKLARDER
ncbi:hypothetical protein [Pseudomonas chlororaphis]|uniref:hypothetical protein n=1 Tax=Pseudomonas chlororaphis TaxID=587753 RepID=UPI0011DCE776|nr:hypothetical protein [Pseudomonas chlororaphis]